MKGLLAACAILALSACASNPRLRYPVPPADKLVCAHEPGRPAGQGPGGAVTDAENGTYLRDLRGAGQSCRDDVDWLRAWFARLND